MKHLSLVVLLFIFCDIGAHGHRSDIKFVENKGQWPSQAKYRADLPGGALFAEQNCLTYNFYDSKFLADVHDQKYFYKQKNNRTTFQSQPQELKMRYHAFRMRPIGARAMQVVPKQQHPESYNYFIGDDASKWASDAHAFEELMYPGIYPKTDMRIYESGESIKYEFILSPGASPDLIQLKYEGLKNIYLDNGNLILETTVNLITEQAPYIYQIINGKQIAVAGKFVLQDSTVSFEITGRYSKSVPLIIDPQLIFSTYSGSTGDNWGNTAAFDEAGNMYSGGTVFASGYPATMGAYDTFFGGMVDVGILKFNPTGTTLLYATYLGGNGTDVPYSLVVNSNDELVIMGASSGNFPTKATSYDAGYNGGSYIDPIGGIIFNSGSDLFVAKLSTDGSSLLGSTYFGGNSNDGVQDYFDLLTINYGDQLRGDVITDDQNNIYICANTSSSSVATPGSAQSIFGGVKDAIVAKFNPTLTTLSWATYIGGNHEDAAYSIQVDSLYNVYVAGGTYSDNFPTTAGVLRPTKPPNNHDGFVTHIASDGSSFLNSTYVGTSSYDQAYFVQLDAQENVYLFGQTTGSYPVSAGVYRNANSGQFIHALSHDLSTTVFSTVIGKGGFLPNISPTAFLVNDCGNIFLSGWGGQINGSYIGGNTFNLPVTSDAYRSTSDGSDFYIMVLSANAQSLLYGTFFGTNGAPADHVDGGTSRFDKRGIIYEAVCAGCGGSDAFPTTPGAYSRVNGSSNCNNGAFKFDLANLEAALLAFRTVACLESSVTVTNLSAGGKTFFWDFGDGQTSTSHSPGKHIYAAPGTYTITLTVTDLTTCIGQDIADTTIVIPPIPDINFNTADTSMCAGDSVQLSATCNPTYKYLWSPKTTLSSDTICNPYSHTLETTTYTVTVMDTNDCVITRNLRVRIPDVQHGINYTNNSDCKGKLGAIFQNNSTGVKFNWFFGDGDSETNTDNMTEHTYPGPGTYTVIMEAFTNGCAIKDTITITLDEVFFPNLLTPNADGKNDVYEIKGITDNWTFEVYNRWGDAVYKNSNYQNEWAAEKLTDGVYYYLITSPDKTRCKGWVEIIR